MESGFSDVTVCNSALLKVGAYPISSLNDGTRAANICQAQYPILRDEVLRAVPWRFALTQVNLATPNATVPVFGYSSAYDIPDSILRVWKVATNPWTEIGQQILCNVDSGISILGIYQNTDPTSWDAQFAEALSWRLAMEIAFALVQSVPLKQEMEKGYKDSLAQARSTNAVIGTPERLIADFWSSSRKYGYNQFWPIDAGASTPYNYSDEQ